MLASIKTVFLIDDDPISNIIHQSLFRKHHWSVTTVVFETGLAALGALEAAAISPPGSFPDVILLDVEMPAYDGWDFLREYAGLPPRFTDSCLLYLLSSGINPFSIQKAQTYPLVKSYLTKPLTLANLNQIGQDFQALRA
jgi:CheY-like chemotaxis protein